MKIYFTSTGLVYGKYWGGGEGAYPAETLKAKNKKELLKEAIKRVKDGTLDSGMGYENVLGAILEVKKHSIIKQREKDFGLIETEIEFVGVLDEKQQDFLEECLFAN